MVKNSYEIIVRLGRFPHQNEALGRKNRVEKTYIYCGAKQIDVPHDVRIQRDATAAL